MVNLKSTELELHYFFSDSTHTIDSFVRHKCEAEILSIAREISIKLGYDIIIETEPSREGGFKEFWKFIERHNVQLTFFATIIALILSRIPVSNSELEKLQIENLKLDNEEKRLNIDKMRKEMEKGKPMDLESFNSLIKFLESDYKIIRHKSTFYKAVQSYSKISKISTTSFEQTKQIDGPHFVERPDFHKFILSTDSLPEITRDNAILEIIAPVLMDGKYKWKGIYEGRTIDFSMNDKDYINSVIKKEITFHNGFFIECVLKIKPKLDADGEVYNTGFSVETVLANVDGNKYQETLQGKIYKKNKNESDRQMTLFS